MPKPSGNIFLGFNLPILVETKCSQIWRFCADDFMSCFACLMIHYLIYINYNKWSQLLALKSAKAAAKSMLQECSSCCFLYFWHIFGVAFRLPWWLLQPPSLGIARQEHKGKIQCSDQTTDNSRWQWSKENWNTSLSSQEKPWKEPITLPLKQKGLWSTLLTTPNYFLHGKLNQRPCQVQYINIKSHLKKKLNGHLWRQVNTS